MHAAAGPLNVPRRFGKQMRLLPFCFESWLINRSTSGRPALRLYSDCYRYCYFVLGCGWGRIFHFPFSASLFVCMNMRHAEYRPARRPLLYIFYVCWRSLFSATSFGGSGPTLSTIEYLQPSFWWQWTYSRIFFSHLLGGSEPTIEYFSAIALVALSNLSGGNLSFAISTSVSSHTFLSGS